MDKPKVVKISKPKVVESPAVRKARLRREKQEALDRKREDVIKKMGEAVEKAQHEKQQEKDGTPQAPSKTEDRPFSAALEEALLGEIRKGEDSCVQFLVSLADGLRRLPTHKFRHFQLGALKLIAQLESEAELASSSSDHDDMLVSKFQLFCFSSSVSALSCFSLIVYASSNKWSRCCLWQKIRR